MPRYFIEVCYKGTSFKGFQIQDNGITIQGEINRALRIILKEEIQTTTSSRTDSGVHAIQNFLHFDTTQLISGKSIYNLNAIIHDDILIRAIYLVTNTAHARFDAIAREYTYHIICEKNPFKKEFAYFYPFPLDIGLMNEAALALLSNSDFSSFAKRHSDVNNFNCNLSYAKWEQIEDGLIAFRVKSNRFLRGMVRALVGTQLLVGRKKISLEEFKAIILAKDCTESDFSAPAHGLFLEKVFYPGSMLENSLSERK